MMRRSSISISYQDLLAYMQKHLSYQEARYNAARGTGGNLPIKNCKSIIHE